MLSELIREIVNDVVSDYANNHWTRDDFDNERERHEYLQELAEGEGDMDSVIDDVLEEIENNDWENDEGDLIDIDINSEELIDYIIEAIKDEADYYLM